MENKCSAEKKRIMWRCLIFVVAAYMFCVIFDPFFFDYHPLYLPLRQLYGCMLAAGVLYVCVRLKYVGLLFYLLFAILAAGLFYAYKVFGYSVGFELINAVLGTNRHELAGFLNYTLYLALAGYIVLIPSIYLTAVYCLGWKKMTIKHFCGIFLTVVIWGVLYEIPPYAITWKHSIFIRLMDKTMRNNREWFMGGAMAHPDVVYNRWRLPYSNLKAIVDGIREYNREIGVDKAEAYPSEDMRKGEDLIFILIVGESVRGDHVSAGGYHRNTMPVCSKESNVCYFKNMYSFAATTHHSVKGLLAGIVNNKAATIRTSFAALLKKHGYACHLYSEDTENITDSRLFHDILGVYMDSCQVCRFPIMEVAEKILSESESRQKKRQFVIVENGTGHYPYINEDQFDTYYPCNMEWLAPRPDNYREILTNDYDNCIVSVDAFCGRLIDGMRHKNAVLLYVSDHGQSLGEDNKFMHGDNENRLLRHVASFIWFSDEYERRHPELVAEMKSVKDKLLVHGQIYATILRLCGIKSEVPLDIGDFVNGDVREVEHNLPKTMNVPSLIAK